MKKTILILTILLIIPSLLYAQKQVKAEDIIKQINEGKAVEYENAVITGTLDLTRIENVIVKRRPRYNSSGSYICLVKVPVSFINCTFENDFLTYYHDNYENAVYFNVFTEDVNFSGSTFKWASSFKYTEFEKKSNFENTEFYDEAYFKYTKFFREGNFKKAVFHDDANFKYTDFREIAHFDEAKFRRDANFKYTKFNRGVNFTKTIFESFANFAYTKFYDYVNFDEALFDDRIDVRHTKFNRRPLLLHLLRSKGEIKSSSSYRSR